MPRRPKDPARQGLDTLASLLPVGIYRTAPDGTILEVNAALASLLGFGDPEELKRINANELYLGKKVRTARIARLGATGKPYGEFRLRGKDGRVVWVRDFARAVAAPDGSLAAIEGAMIDITELRRTEAALRRSEREYRLLFEKAHDAILIFAIEDESILDVNDAACRLYGFDRRELLSMSLEAISKDVRRGKERLARLLRGEEQRTFETTHFRKDGAELRLEINATLVTFRGRRAVLSINRDVTLRHRRMDDLRRMALTDPLTGIANRLLFEDHLSLALAQACHSGAPLAVLFLDLDGFKEVNDAYGHAVGDEVLRETAARLLATLRRGDTVARMGGDEFVAVLPELARTEDAEEVAKKVLESLRSPVVTSAGPASVTASLGVAIHPADGGAAEELLAAADRAMYEAKVAGKNAYRRASGAPPG